MKTIKIAIIGFGNAAKAFVKILHDKQTVLSQDGIEILVTAISTGTKGNLIDPTGLDTIRMLQHLNENTDFKGFGPTLTAKTSQQIIEEADYDVMIELTPLNIFSGQPAIDHIKLAMNRGKHVITANKGPIAWAYHELQQLAKQNHVLFFFETTVMDGTPIFNLVKETLPYCQVTEIKGILNTTTNFILGHLEKGEELDAIMAEGLRRGFVEADPSLDTEGWDAAAKLTALMNVLMDANIRPTEVIREGIGNITLEDLSHAKANDQTIKLLCVGNKTDQGITAMVRPTLIPMTDLYAAIDETSSVISITTDLMGKLTVVEHDPEIEQTGFGIFSDLIRLIKSI